MKTNTDKIALTLDKCVESFSNKKTDKGVSSEPTDIWLGTA